MAIKIASFNVHNMSLGSSEEKINKIADIINDNHIDIVALQEVLSEGKMLSGSGMGGNSLEGQEKAYERSIVSRLTGSQKGWGALWGNPHTESQYYPYMGNDSRGEGYGFLWNKDKFELPKGENGKEICPRIWRNYHVPDNGSIRLAREPFFGRFIYTAVKGIEIRLITTHIIYGKPKDENIKVDLDYGATMMRRNEFNILAGQIYQRVSNYHMTPEGTVPYTIMLGDYNLNLQASGAGTPYVPAVACFDEYGHLIEQSLNEPIVSAGASESFNMIYTVQTGKSTLKEDGTDYSKNYDHFSFDEETRKKVIDEQSVKIIEAGQTEEERKKYRDTMSDHVPIIIELNFK